MGIRTALAVLSTALAFVSFYPYFRDVMSGLTRPHAFTWLVWGLLTAIACAGQVAAGGGPGAWVTGVSAVLCLTVFVAALLQGDSDVTAVDWACLAGAGLALVLWAGTDAPLAAVILVSVIDALGFAPTFRKAYRRPYTETVSAYVLAIVKWIPGIAALEVLTVTTWLYPASIVVLNSLFVAMVMSRRRALAAV